MKFPILAFLIWRLLIFIPLQRFSISPWATFDGLHYLSIASNGYTFDGRFFPLYPILIKIFSLPFSFPDSYLYSGFFLSNLFFLLSLILFFNLVKEQYSQKVAKQAVIWMLIFPTSFFFGSIYSESLFLFLALLTFKFAGQGKWLSASITSSLLGITRFIGIFILPVLIYEFIIREKVDRGKLFVKSLPFFLIPSGLITFAVFCFYKWGDALYFIKTQGQLGNSRSVDSVILPFQTIYRYFKILTTVSFQYEYWIAVFELSIFLFVSFLIYMCWKKKINTGYIIFALFSFLIPASSGTFSGLPRYVITIFPIFIALALIKNKIFKFAYVVISPILLFVLLVLFSKGYFIA